MKSRFFVVSGLLLIAAALCLTGYNIRDGKRAAKASGEVLEKLAAVSETTAAESTEADETKDEPQYQETRPPLYVIEPEMEMPTVNVDGEEYSAVLSIPSIGLELPVNADWSYEALKNSPCRYAGSAYTKDLVIAAHNYPGHFANLKSLSPGDEVILTDMAGNVFRYAVAAKETLPPGAVEEMIGGKWALSLFTCTVGGQFRVVVRCDAAE
ncbi:MAG: sortase [Eubacteriales bacterium]